MEAINYESMKTNEPTRNFDSVDITNDYNIGAQNAQGLYGAFKFFHGIKSFFKGISALGTLATTSKIPVTDNDGNVTYTTPAAIKTALSLVDSTALNGALADYKKNVILNSNYGSKIDYTIFNNILRGNFFVTAGTNVPINTVWGIITAKPSTDVYFIIKNRNQDKSATIKINADTGEITNTTVIPNGYDYYGIFEYRK